jgi:hypothetical protein
MIKDSLFQSAKKNFILITLFLILLAGLPTTIYLFQRQQEIRSRASSNNVVGSGLNISGDVTGYLVGSDNTVLGNVNKNVVGSSNHIYGNVLGCVAVGSGNIIGGNVGAITGSDNHIHGNVLGCIVGSGNSIDGSVAGTVTGSGNQVRDGVGNDSSLCTTLVLCSDTVAPSAAPPPQCTTAPTCGSCNAPVNTCSVGNGSQTCQYTGSAPCAPVSFTQSCSVNTCISGYSCTQGECNPNATPTPIATSTPIPTPTLIPTSTSIPTATPTLMPTDTPKPTPTGAFTSISLTVFEHGIGHSGDNTNPNDYSFSNQNPLHASIPANIQLYNLNNQLIASGAGVLSYDSTTGSYKSGLVCSGGNSFQTGHYNVKVKTAYHLRRLLPGIQHIQVGQNNSLPQITLVAGDINNDNQLNILDYNILLGCYSDLAAAANCTADNKVASDLNDDGHVNQIDYNLFLREVATQPGE